MDINNHDLPDFSAPDRKAVWAFVLFWVNVAVVFAGMAKYLARNPADWLFDAFVVVPLVIVSTLGLAVVVIISSLSALRSGCSRRMLAAFPLWMYGLFFAYILYCVIGMCALGQ